MGPTTADGYRIAMGFRGRVLGSAALAITTLLSACSESQRTVDYESYPIEIADCDSSLSPVQREYTYGTETSILVVTTTGTVKNENDEEIEVTIEVDFSKPQFFAKNDSEDHPRHRRTEVTVVVPPNGSQTWTASVEKNGNEGDDSFFVKNGEYPGADNMDCEVDDYRARFTADIQAESAPTESTPERPPTLAENIAAWVFLASLGGGIAFFVRLRSRKAAEPADQS